MSKHIQFFYYKLEVKPYKGTKNNNKITPIASIRVYIWLKFID